MKQRVPKFHSQFCFFVSMMILLVGRTSGQGAVKNKVTLEDIMMMDSSTGDLFETKTEDGILHARILPHSHYVSAFLNLGIPKRFVYMNEIPENVLSIIVTPCTSPLFWTVRYWPITNTSHRLPHPQLQKSFRTDRSATYYDLSSRHGIYSIDIKALYSDSYVHLYGTTGKEPIRISSNFIEPSDVNPGIRKPKIVVRRLRGNRIHVKWEASAYNPQNMRYCIVVNTQQDYQSLCAAQGVKYGVLPPDLTHVSFYNHLYKKRLRNQKKTDYPFDNNSNDEISGVILNSPSSQNLVQSDGRHFPLKGYEQRERARDITIGCVNKKTNYIVHNLTEGKLYYFNVFIKDASTNLTYPYVRTTMKYRVPKVSHEPLIGEADMFLVQELPNGITDSKPTKVIVPPGQPTLVKFNLKKPCSELSMYVMVCNGGRVTYQVIHAYKSIAQSEIVDSFDIFKMAMPGKGRYYIRFRQSEDQQQAYHNNSSQPVMVEVFVSKKNKRFPLPKLPYNTALIEDVSKRSCDSVKIFWQPSPEPRDNEYCMFFKEETRRRNFNFKKPNQCDVERSLNSDPYVTHSLCLQKSVQKKGDYLNHTVTGLKPERTYIVQLIVRRHKAKALSYDLFHVETRKQCTDVMDY